MKKTRFFLGLDLGQSQDFTALCVVEWKEVLGEWDPVAFAHRKEPVVRLRYLERLPLGTPYPDIVARIKRMLESATLADGERYLVVDATGVGRPVLDLLRREKLPCRILPVTITGGASEGMSASMYRVPKRDLIVLLQIMFQEGILEIASGLREGPTFIKEMGEMRVQMTNGGREKYSARSGEHDDLVLSVALACWGVNKIGGGQKCGPSAAGRLV